MEWEIFSFVGFGPIKFGMSTADVQTILGPPSRTRSDEPNHRRELRAADLPIITYENGSVAEIEAFYDMDKTAFEGKYLFRDNPIAILQYLETRNGVVLEHLGTLLFENLGIALGRIDENVVEEHNLAVFMKGAWDDRISSFKPISFLR